MRKKDRNTEKNDLSQKKCYIASVPREEVKGGSLR